MKKRILVILCFIILFIVVITIWNYSYYKGLEQTNIVLDQDQNTPVIPSESGIFQRMKYALDYTKMPEDTQYQRGLEKYYKNRAYWGAPPSIPHPVESALEEQKIESCLKCHQNGGFVSKFNSYAPVSPHPEMINCRQCHVEQNTKKMFARNTFHKITPPKSGNGINSALVGSPPVIPHQIKMRENCLSCHAGPSAPKEIRVSHPERINCRQCHVSKNLNNTSFSRALNNER